MRFTAELTWADRELARVRSEIAHADTASLSQLTPVRERAAAIRATAYIWLAATLERVVRDAVQTTLREISLLALPLKDLRLSLFPLICEGDFDSIGSRSRNKAWESKITLFLKTVDMGPALLSEDILPLDGRTIRAEHFDVIWLVFGLSSKSVPSPLHRFALKDLADGRNEVAHGHVDPVTFGRTKATNDLLQLTNRVDDVVSHLLTELDTYVNGKMYVR